jgi:hypothetical protein
MHFSERFAICGDAVYADEAWFHCAVMEILRGLFFALRGTRWFRFFSCWRTLRLLSGDGGARHVVRPEVLMLRFD